jgi:hypothetical protein
MTGRDSQYLAILVPCGDRMVFQSHPGLRGGWDRAGVVIYSVIRARLREGVAGFVESVTYNAESATNIT